MADDLELVDYSTEPIEEPAAPEPAPIDAASRELDDSRDDDDQDFRRKATEVLPDTEQDELDEKTPLGSDAAATLLAPVEQSVAPQKQASEVKERQISRLGRASFRKTATEHPPLVRQEGKVTFTFTTPAPASQWNILPFCRVQIKQGHRPGRCVALMNRVTLRKRDARATGLSGEEYLVVHLGVDQKADAAVALIACPAGTVVCMTEDCVVRVHLVWVTSSEPENDSDRAQQAARILATATRCIPSEELQKRIKSEKSKRKQQWEELSDSGSNASALAAEQATDSAGENKQTAHAQSGRPKRKRDEDRQSNGRGDSRVSRSAKRAKTEHAKEWPDLSVSAGSAETDRPRPASRKEDSKRDSAQIEADGAGSFSSSSSNSGLSMQPTAQRGSSSGSDAAAVTRADLTSLKNVLGTFAQQLALLPAQLQAAAIPTVAPSAEQLRRRIPLGPSGGAAETAVPLRSVANSSARLNSENKSQSYAAQFSHLHEKENLPPADISGATLDELQNMELELTRQKVEVLRDELARQKLENLDKQIAVVQRLQSPRRMSPIAPRRI